MTKSKKTAKGKKPSKSDKRANNGGARENAGAPMRVLTDDEFEKIGKLAGIACTQDEICSIMDIDEKTLHQCFVRQKKIEFSAFYKKHFETGNQSLRRRQFQAAMDGNVPMMIWLGKQRLSQMDQTHQKSTGEQKIVHDLSEATIARISKKLNEDY